MTLPHADNQVPEQGFDAGSQSAPANDTDTRTAAPAVLVLNRAGCIKSLNCSARSLLGDAAEGLSWPLLRNATFGPSRDGLAVLSRGGRHYIEHHSGTSCGERIVCLQLLEPAPQSGTAAAQPDTLAPLIHQLRTPLTAANLYLDQLLRRLGHDPELQRLARKSVQQLHAVEQLLAAGSALLAPGRACGELLDVDALLQQLQEQCGAIALGLGAHLHCHSDTAGLAIRADRAALLSALGNLVINAAQHPRKGQLLRICVVGRAEAGQLVLDVSDTGCGVEPALRDTIFDRYETTRAGGNGLGLDIARHVFTRFDGHIEQSNNTAGGATFSVRFPLAVLDAAA